MVGRAEELRVQGFGRKIHLQNRFSRGMSLMLVPTGGYCGEELGNGSLYYPCDTMTFAISLPSVPIYREYKRSSPQKCELAPS